MIPEREREAVMRLTMCARGECPMCKYEEQCDNWDFRMELATKNMNILADALRKDEPSSSEIPNCCKDEPLPKAINGVKIADAVAWADKWLEDNPVSEMWDMIRTLRDATEWQNEPQTERSE